MLGSAAGGWWLANRTVVAGISNDSDEAETTTVLSSDLAMPDVRGLTQDEASQVLADSGFSAAIIRFVDAPSGAPEGIVVTQTPTFGTESPGEIVLGLAVPATMPNLAGKTQERSNDRIVRSGCIGRYLVDVRSDRRRWNCHQHLPASWVKPSAETATISLASAGSGLPLAM